MVYDFGYNKLTMVIIYAVVCLAVVCERITVPLGVCKPDLNQNCMCIAHATSHDTHLGGMIICLALIEV